MIVKSLRRSQVCSVNDPDCIVPVEPQIPNGKNINLHKHWGFRRFQKECAIFVQKVQFSAIFAPFGTLAGIGGNPNFVLINVFAVWALRLERKDRRPGALTRNSCESSPRKSFPRTDTLFLKLFGPKSRDIPANPGISRPKSLISLVSRDIPNFLSLTRARGRPLPHRKISGLKRERFVLGLLVPDFFWKGWRVRIVPVRARWWETLYLGRASTGSYRTPEIILWSYFRYLGKSPSVPTRATIFPGPSGRKITEESHKESFGGLQKSPRKYPKKSKNTPTKSPTSGIS